MKYSWRVFSTKRYTNKTFTRDALEPSSGKPRENQGSRVRANSPSAAQQNNTSTFASSSIAMIQRAVGNCAVAEHCMNKGKTVVSNPNDYSEREADRIANQVSVSRGSTIREVTPIIQRLPRQPPAAQTSTSIPDVDRVISGPGERLPGTLQREMEGNFGQDFSAVRVHADPSAQQSAMLLDANAYTVGNNMVFGAGQFSPGSDEGQRLIAHELTHVVQQSGASSFTKRTASDQNSPAISSLAADHVVANSQARGVVQRDRRKRTSGSKSKSESRQPPQVSIKKPFTRGWHLIFANPVSAHEIVEWLFKDGVAPEGFSIALHDKTTVEPALEWDVTWADWKPKGETDRALQFIQLLTAYGNGLWYRAMEGEEKTPAEIEEEKAEEAQRNRLNEIHNETVVAAFNMTAGEVLEKMEVGAYEINGYFAWIGYKGRLKVLQTVTTATDQFNEDMRFYLRHGLNVHEAVDAFTAQWDEIFTIELAFAGAGASYQVPKSGRIAIQEAEGMSAMGRRLALNRAMTAAKEAESVVIKTAVTEEKMAMESGVVSGGMRSGRTGQAGGRAPQKLLDYKPRTITSEVDPRSAKLSRQTKTVPQTVYDVKKVSTDPDIQSEVRMGEHLADDGHAVQFTTGADLRVDGMTTDVKHLRSASSIPSAINRARDQAEAVAIDGTTIKLTEAETLKEIARFNEEAAMRPRKYQKIKKIYILLGDGKVHIYHRDGTQLKVERIGAGGTGLPR